MRLAEGSHPFVTTGGQTRRMRSILILIVAFVGACQPPSSKAEPAAPSIRTCFEPDEDCIALAVREIGAAEREVLVQAAGFSNRRIVSALREAEQRGVNVRMIIDDSRENNERILAVQQGGAELLTDNQVTSQHNKIMVFDRRRVLTGSQNFTKASETHAENMLVIEHQPTVDAYVANWQRRAAASRPYHFTPSQRLETED